MAEALYRFLGFFGYEHPLHPVLTHLVVGPVIAGFVFELIGLIKRNQALRKTAYYLSIFALVFWVFTVASGFIDWAERYNLTQIREITIKIVLAGTLLVILVPIIVLHRQLPERSIVPILLFALASLNVAALGYFGGNLVYGGEGAVAGETRISEDGWKETEVEEYALAWRFGEQTMEVRLTVDTTGWIAVGFGSTGTMAGSDLYIGYVDPEGRAVVVDSYGSSPQEHQPDVELGGSQNATNVDGGVRRGRTTLSFTIPLDSGDEYDVVYAEGRTYQVLLAYAGDDEKDTETYHGTGGRLAVELTL